MLHITQPYTRLISGVNVPGEEGHELVISIVPPGLSIGFRMKRQRRTYYLSIVDCFLTAKHNPEPHRGSRLPATVKEPDLKEEVLELLRNEPDGLNIGELNAKLKEKRLKMTRESLGAYLKLLKEFGMITQRGLHYSLAK